MSAKICFGGGKQPANGGPPALRAPSQTTATQRGKVLLGTYRRPIGFFALNIAHCTQRPCGSAEILGNSVSHSLLGLPFPENHNFYHAPTELGPRYSEPATS